MNQNQLNCFIAVAHYQNFTKAANKLHVSQSGMSYNIAELEKEIGVKLFERNHASLTITKAGESFLQEAVQIVSMMNNAVIKAKQNLDRHVGKLNIGYCSAPIIYQYMDTLKKFQNSYPDIDVSYNSYNTMPPMPGLLECGELDIAFIMKQSIINKNIIQWKSLYSDSFCIVVDKRYVSGDKPLVSVLQFAGKPLILMNRKYSPGLFEMAIAICMEEGVVPLFLKIKTDYQHEMGIAWNKNTTNSAVQLFLESFSIEK